MNTGMSSLYREVSSTDLSPAAAGGLPSATRECPLGIPSKTPRMSPERATRLTPQADTSSRAHPGGAIRIRVVASLGNVELELRVTEPLRECDPDGIRRRAMATDHAAWGSRRDHDNRSSSIPLPELEATDVGLGCQFGKHGDDLLGLVNAGHHREPIATRGPIGVVR